MLKVLSTMMAVAILGVVTFQTAPVSNAALPVEVEWISQFGVSDNSALTYSQDVDVSGNVYIGGGTTNALTGQVSSGGTDAFIRKYDVNGNVLWTRQFGTSMNEEVVDISVDASGVYIVGSTAGTFSGQTNSGGVDIFIRKYDFDGNESWTRQIGTSEDDRGITISVLSSEIYAAGITAGTFSGQTSEGEEDVFLVKYDSSGSQTWLRQFGTAGFDEIVGVKADASGVYVAGGTDGTFPGFVNLGDYDAFVRKYDASGNISWTRQFGTASFDDAFDISINGMAVYAVGTTDGTLSGQTSSGLSDAFIRKYDTSGNEEWTRQFGTSGNDDAFAISAVITGIYVIGGTNGTFSGQTNLGETDIFIRKYDLSGVVAWTKQFGTALSDLVFGAAVSVPHLYVTGTTLGALPDQTQSGFQDAFVVKFKEDIDSDGILNDVDLALDAFSSNFSDGVSTGNIFDRGDQNVRVEDHSNLSLGLLVSATSAGTGIKVAKIQSCGNVAKSNLDSNASMVVTCGSVTLEVLSGTVITEFTADDGTVATASMDAGSELKFEPESQTFTASADNTEPVAISIDNKTIEIDPGSVAVIGADVLINPEGKSNIVNPLSNRELRVTILSNNNFDATQTVLSTVGLGLNETAPFFSKAIDVDQDGRLDTLYYFHAGDSGIQCGDTQVSISGETFGGVTVFGVGVIRTTSCN